MSLFVTDHALLRFLERVHGLPLERMREELSAKTGRARAAAQSIGGGQYTVVVDGVKFRCCDDCVVTVVTGDERDRV